MLFPNFVFGTHLKGIISTLCARDIKVMLRQLKKKVMLSVNKSNVECE